jgi:hypothetical protein
MDQQADRVERRLNIDFVMSVCALLISAVAGATALYQLRNASLMMSAQTWPYVVAGWHYDNRSGLAILNSAISGNSGQKAWPRKAGQEGVFDGQEIRAADAPHAHGGVQGTGSVGGGARGPDAGRSGGTVWRHSLRFTPTRLRTGSGNCSNTLPRYSGPRSGRRPVIWLRCMPRSDSSRWNWIF